MAKKDERKASVHRRILETGRQSNTISAAPPPKQEELTELQKIMLKRKQKSEAATTNVVETKATPNKVEIPTEAIKSNPEPRLVVTSPKPKPPVATKPSTIVYATPKPMLNKPVTAKWRPPASAAPKPWTPPKAKAAPFNPENKTVLKANNFQGGVKTKVPPLAKGHVKKFRSQLPEWSRNNPSKLEENAYTIA